MWYVVCSVGRPKHVKVMAGGLEGDVFIGPKAEVRGISVCGHLLHGTGECNLTLLYRRTEDC